MPPTVYLDTSVILHLTDPPSPKLLSLGAGLTARANESSRHIACAALNRNDILLTWNCRDIANARRLPALRFLMDAEELQLPELVTPFERMENRHEDF